MLIHLDLEKRLFSRMIPAQEAGFYDIKEFEDIKDGGVVKLKRRFGLGSCVAYLVGFMIGSGIYIAPSGVLNKIESPGLVMVLWSLGSVFAMGGGLTNAELGTTYPTSGDKYVYMQIFYGDLAGFIHLWQYLFISRPGANTIKCLIFATYVTYPFFSGCELPDSSSRLLAAVLACSVTALNITNIDWAGRMQGFCAFCTVIALGIISVTGFVYMGMGHTSNLQNSFETTEEMDFGAMALGFYSLIFAYGGWFALNYMVEELHDPYKNLPRGIVISILIVMVLYISVNVSYIAVLGADTIRNSDAVAMTFASRTLGKFSWVIAILIAINTSGSLNGGILVGSRLCFAGARQGHLPSALSLINIDSFSPITALLLQLFIMLLMCFLADIYTLLNNFVFINTAVEMLCAYGLIYKRYKEPDRHRPVKLPIWIPIVYAILTTLLVLGPLISKPVQTGSGLLIILATGVPYYMVFVKKIIKMPQKAINYYECIHIFLQKSLWCVPQEDKVDMIKEVMNNAEDTYSK